MEFIEIIKYKGAGVQNRYNGTSTIRLPYIKYVKNNYIKLQLWRFYRNNISDIHYT